MNVMCTRDRYWGGSRWTMQCVENVSPVRNGCDSSFSESRLSVWGVTIEHDRWMWSGWSGKVEMHGYSFVVVDIDLQRCPASRRVGCRGCLERESVAAIVMCPVRHWQVWGSRVVPFMWPEEQCRWSFENWKYYPESVLSVGGPPGNLQTRRPAIH